ncbi:zinc finger protein with KRAB and SCAN domains 3 isoform X2 [Bombina bombina]|uniref:zinc finger protein with KRAB and SCAN domains 3 isoform X2 n=1 Tax=Bombina bombina TaxID=8345 RepID=UPI00235A9FA9|nr:zinc finger protein with KRAB and SCAN domains 3 isoform X2 [Bombina bombina]
MSKYRKQMAEQFLSQALGIICLLTGEEYTIVKKTSRSSIQQLSREVPIKCDDVAVYFSMEEWEYIEEHKELYKDAMMETHPTLRTMEIPGNESSEYSDEILDTGAHTKQNIQPVEAQSDFSAELTGYSDVNLHTGGAELVQNIQPVETLSNISADWERGRGGQGSDSIGLGASWDIKGGQLEVGCEVARGISSWRASVRNGGGFVLPSEGKPKGREKRVSVSHPRKSLSRVGTEEGRPGSVENLGGDKKTQALGTDQGEKAGPSSQTGGHKSSGLPQRPRIREERYSEAEKLALIKAYVQRTPQLERRNLDGNIRSRLWEEIREACVRVNNRQRTMDSIKHRCQDCRRVVKEKIKLEEEQANQPGGQLIVYSGWEELLRDKMTATPKIPDGQTAASSERQLCEYDAVIVCDSEETEDPWLRNMTEVAEQEICEKVIIGENYTTISYNTEETEDQWLQNVPEAPEKKIFDNIITGDVKTEVTHNAEQTYDLYLKSQQEAVKQEISDNISIGEFTDFKTPSHRQSAEVSFNLLQNQSSHMGNVCSGCGKCFTWKSQLINHQKIHTGERAFSCTECGIGFIRKSKLIDHLKIHTGGKSFSCSECGKCFTQKSNLIAHQKIHTGEKGFLCSACGKCFTQKSHLFSHQKSHTGEKEYSCSECSKCFTWKSTLTNHMKIHTGEKDFVCSKCGKCFTQQSTLINHQKIHIKENQSLNSEVQRLTRSCHPYNV